MPKIKFENISQEKEIPKHTQQKYLPDDYYTYDIHRHINTDFHNIKKKQGMHINICCFMVIQNKPNNIIANPFLQYLLYKYPKNTNKVGNICVFPFEKYKNGEILDVGKKIVKKLFNKTYKQIGYIQNKDGIFIFYNIEFQSLLVRNTQLYDNQPHYLWTLIDEICNHKKYITAPIHKSVSNLFYKNPKLIYLKNKEKLCIETPSVCYYGESQELLNYIAAIGIKSSPVRLFGPYYYFNDFKQAIRRASWSSNYESRNIYNNSITDKNGKFEQGGIVRFAVFLGNYRVVLDRKSDTLQKTITALDSVNKPQLQNMKKINKTKGKWTEEYDSLMISNYKNNNRSGYFWAGTGYILKNFNAFTSLSIHLVDTSTLKTNWDLEYDGYNIK